MSRGRGGASTTFTVHEMTQTTVRALIQLDRLQPQFAAYNGATVQGSIPLAGDTILIGEMAPGNEVFRVIDVALKAATIEATSQIVEREFGFFILRSPMNSEIVAARDAVLSYLGISMTDRLKPRVDSSQVITSVEPYQAQLLNKWRSGALVVPGQTLGILECSPAAYSAVAANEAEKSASINVVEVRAVGRYGRFFMSGTEAEVSTAMEAAVAALEAVEGRTE
jgi:ethanolamine utilization microcompartment shell protein EutL